MAGYTILVLKVIVSFVDLILFPIHYLIYKQPWKHDSKPLNLLKHQLILSPDGTQITYKPAQPEPTCQNKEAMVKENLNTMHKLIQYMARKYGSKPCLGHRRILGTKMVDAKVTKVILEEKYTWQTYSKVFSRVDDVAYGLYSIGFKPLDKIIIYADTCSEWLITALACFKSSITIVTLYTNLGDDGIIYGINQVQVEVMVTSDKLLPKILLLKDQLPHLKTIIVISQEKTNKYFDSLQDHFTIKSFEEIESKGSEAKRNNTEVVLKNPSPDDPAVIMYTSGSTGEPKGVMLTHQNMTSSLMACCVRACNLMGHERSPNEVYLAFLPLAHIFEITQEIIVLSLGIKVGYSSPSTLTDSSPGIVPGQLGDISVLKPTVMAAVPIILDRIYKSLRTKVGQKGPTFEEFFNYAVDYRASWKKRGFDTPLLNRIVFKKVQKSFGGQLKVIIGGGAPLAPNTHDFLRTALNITLAQGYGLTETTGGISLSTKKDLSVATVGQTLPCVKIKLKDWAEGDYLVHGKNDTGPCGEILIGGPMVASGYYNHDKPSDFFTDPDDGIRWFQTGDIGQIDKEDGVLRIIDRKKDLIKLQNGEYVSLGKVENCLKEHPLVTNVCVIADSSKTFCVALVLPDMGYLADLAQKLNLNTYLNTSTQELYDNSTLVRYITSLLFNHGFQGGLKKFEIPKSIALISIPWTPETGLVTATFKLKRKLIQDRYESIIGSLYAQEFSCDSSNLKVKDA